MADHACAEERARRLQEADEEMRAGIRIDSLKERIKDVMVDVQEQMLLQIFRGHKVRWIFMILSECKQALYSKQPSHP